MAKKTDSEIATIVGALESKALDYVGPGSKIGKNRETLIKYYHCAPFGDEVKGESSYVTSDVHDVVESMLPILLKTFTQGKYIAVFNSDKEIYAKENEQKTIFCNYVFGNQHDPVKILHSFFKDALLQYSGHVKIYWDEAYEVTKTSYKGLSELELMKLKMDEDVQIEKIEQSQQLTVDGSVLVYDVECKVTRKNGKIAVDNIPPEEFLILGSSRDFFKPDFCGHRALKSKSDLVSMGFDRGIIDSLPTESSDSEIEQARGIDGLTGAFQDTSVGDSSRDRLYLGEYYVYLDEDGDGISELWQVFYAGNQVLRKQIVEEHPFASITPIPMPHTPIGTCPADLCADIQRLKSILFRQLLNNIYHSNKPRTVSNDRVNKDHLLSVSAGSDISVSGNADVQSALMPLTIPLQSADIMQAIEMVDRMREIRTGTLRDGQGLDSEALNKTATAFVGVRDSAQMRIELISRMFAVGVKEIFNKIASVAARNQRQSQQIMVFGEELEITPSEWKSRSSCTVDVGIGAGDKLEKITNLNFVLSQQKELIASGSTLADQGKIFNTLRKIISEAGLKDIELYFNNPEKPAQVLMAENEQLKIQVAQLQAQAEDSLVKAEQIRSQTRLMEKEIEAKVRADIEGAKLDQQDRHHDDKLALDLTKLEVQSNKNIPGSLV